jgi:predicted RNA-binding protein with PUA-like domain
VTTDDCVGWLLKSEPGEWSYADQAKATTPSPWSGVRNAQALKYMRAMQEGDLALFYETGDVRAIVGLVRVARAFYLDPTDPSSGLIDVVAVAAANRPLTLAQVKADPTFAQTALVRQSRLSVMPLDAASWSRMLTLAGLPH